MTSLLRLEHERLLSRLDEYYCYYYQENVHTTPPPPSDDIINDTLNLSVEEFLKFLKKPRHLLATANNPDKAYQRAMQHIEYLKLVRNKAIVDHLRYFYQEISNKDKDCPAIVFAKKLKYLQVEINKLARDKDLLSFKARQEESKMAHRLEQEKMRRLTLKDALQSLQIFVHKRIQDLEQQKERHRGSADLHRNVELYKNLHFSLEAIAGDIIRNSLENTLGIVESSQYRTKETDNDNENFITKDTTEVASSAQSSKASYISDRKPQSSTSFAGKNMATNTASNDKNSAENLSESRLSSTSTTSSSSSERSRKRRRYTPFMQEDFDMVGKEINIHNGFCHFSAIHEERKVESEEKDTEEGECVTENIIAAGTTQNSTSLHALFASVSPHSNRKIDSVFCEQNTLRNVLTDVAVLQDVNGEEQSELENQQIDIFIDKRQQSDDDDEQYLHLSHATTRLRSSSPISIPSSSSTALSVVSCPTKQELRQNLKDPQCYDDQLLQQEQQNITFVDSVNRETSNNEEKEKCDVSEEIDQNRNTTASQMFCSSPISIHSSSTSVVSITSIQCQRNPTQATTNEEDVRKPCSSRHSSSSHLSSSSSVSINFLP